MILDSAFNSVVTAAPVIPDNVIGLVITGVFGVIVAIVAGIMSRRGAKLGSRENRAPDVQEMWIQQEADRRTRQLVEDMWWTIRRMFQSYYRRVTSAILLLNLTPAQLAVFELNQQELNAINAKLPEDEPEK